MALGRVVQRSRAVARALAEAEPWLVAPSLIVGLMVPHLLGAALAVAALFWLVRWIAWGRPTVRTPGDWQVAFLVLLIPVTLRVTTLPEVTREQVQWLLSGIALYYVVANWVQSARRERAVVLGVAGAGLLAALIAPFAVEWVTSIKFTFIPAAVYAGFPLIASSPVNPNVLAGAIVLGLPVPLALLMFDGPRMRWRQRIAMATAVAGMAAILVLTKSRGALMAAVAAALGLSLLRWRRSWIVMVAAALLAALALWLIGPAHLLADLTATGSLVGVRNRFEIWSRGLYLIRDFPLTGIGMGTFEPLVKARYPWVVLPQNAYIPHSHNIFLQVAVDLGLPGLGAWLGLLFLAVFSAQRVYQAGRREGLAWGTGLGAGLLASQLALLVHGMVDAAVWGAHSGMVVWGLWGICAASYNLRYAARPVSARMLKARVMEANDVRRAIWRYERPGYSLSPQRVGQPQAARLLRRAERRPVEGDCGRDVRLHPGDAGAPGRRGSRLRLPGDGKDAA